MYYKIYSISVIINIYNVPLCIQIFYVYILDLLSTHEINIIYVTL